MGEPTDIEIALERNDVNKIKDFIKGGGNIYKELDKEAYFHFRETLLSRACRENKTEIVEILLDVYERDYKIAEKFVNNEVNKAFLLTYVFIAWSEVEINEVLELSKKSQSGSKKSLVFLADRLECVLVSIADNKELMFKLYQNGFLTINSRTKDGASPGQMLSLDLLKRMVSIGLNFKEILPGTDCDDHVFIENVINQTNCIGLIKYCLTELNLEHKDLLQLTAKNKNIHVFEFVLDYLCTKNGFSNQKEFLQNYCNENVTFLENCYDCSNYTLLAHIFTVYNVKMKEKAQFFRAFLKQEISVKYIEEILKIEKENFDDLLDSIQKDIDLTVLDYIWKGFDKKTLKAIKKNNVTFIITMYKSYKLFQPQVSAYFDMIDHLAIYDKGKGNTALFMALELDCEPLVKHLITKGADLLYKNKEGHTALTLACKYCTPEVVRLLLRTDSNLINEIGSNGNYPLNELVQRDDSFVGVFKKMIKKGANVHVLDQQSNTLLHNAVLSQNIEFVKACLEAGVDPTIKGVNHNTALHLSAKETLLDIFDLILDTGKVDIESKNYRGNTILHNVCKSYFPYFFFSFVEKAKPNVNALNNAGQSPMYFCFENERFKKLLEMGADTSIVGENNFSFYISAADEWKIDILEEVFSNPNIDLTITSTDGQNLLECLPDMRMFIDQYFENENFKEMFRKCTNSRSFFCATATCNLPFIKYMFEYGEPPLEARNDAGETAIFGNLRYAFNKEVLEYLIEKGADVNAQLFDI